MAVYFLKQYLTVASVVKEEDDEVIATSKRKITILYGTTTGTARNFATALSKRISQSSTNIPVTKIVDLADYDEDSLDKEDIVLFICSTWTNGCCPESCAFFFDWLKDFSCDFRVSKDHLAKLSYAAFGLGGEIYNKNYCKVVSGINSSSIYRSE